MRVLQSNVLGRVVIRQRRWPRLVGENGVGPSQSFCSGRYNPGVGYIILLMVVIVLLEMNRGLLPLPDRCVELAEPDHRRSLVCFSVPTRSNPCAAHAEGGRLHKSSASAAFLEGCYHAWSARSLSQRALPALQNWLLSFSQFLRQL